MTSLSKLTTKPHWVPRLCAARCCLDAGLRPADIDPTREADGIGVEGDCMPGPSWLISLPAIATEP